VPFHRKIRSGHPRLYEHGKFTAIPGCSRPRNTLTCRWETIGEREMGINIYHTMVRVKDLAASMAFYELLGLRETRRYDNEQGRFTLSSWPPRGRRSARWN
jgi:hypothetical protein